MEGYLPSGGFQLPFQRRLSRLYNDTKKSSDFVVKEPIQVEDDPEIKALHRKLRIQKDRLVSWGLEWSDPNQAAEIDESLSKAGLSDLVGSIMATIKDILAEAEPLWAASKRPATSSRASEKSIADRKSALVVWDKGRFEDLIRDLTASIDTLCDLSRTRSAGGLDSASSKSLKKSDSSLEDLRGFGSTRIRAPKVISPETFRALAPMQQPSSKGSASRPVTQEIAVMGRQAYSDLTNRSVNQPWLPLLIDYARFDPVYSQTGVMPALSRFEKLSTGLQSESQRAPGAWIGLPHLLGYHEDMENSRLALVYQFPSAFQPVVFDQATQGPVSNTTTLAELLERPDFEPRLEAKFKLAHNLANTVFDMHARGIVHGNLQATAISFCNVGRDPGISDGEVDIRRPLITSFDLFPESSPRRPKSPALSLYRHPLDPRVTAQSPLALNEDNKTLDLYSLAMILVSIGLWTRLENLTPSRDSQGITESVLKQLAIRCGTPYMKAAKVCWNAVEQELARPGKADDILDHVQIRTSRYLEACCILDGVSGLDDRFGDDSARLSPTLNLQTDVPVGTPTASSSKPAEASGYDLKTPVSTNTPTSESAAVKKMQEAAAEANVPLKPEFPATEATMGTEPQAKKERSSKLRLYPQVTLPTEKVETWNTVIMPQINMALKSFYRKHPESVEISLESIGESPQKTTPTVLVVCTSVGKVRAILTKKLEPFFDGTGFSLKVCRGSMLRSRKGPTRSMARGQGNELSGFAAEEKEQDHSASAANADYQKRPHNGASIGAWIGDKHLPPVSFGGLIMVDDRPFGMTVHHMLDDPDAAHLSSNSAETGTDSVRASAPPHRSGSHDLPSYSHDEDWSTDSGGDDYSCEFSDDESNYSATDLTSDDEEEDDDDEFEQFDEPGDIPGVEPGCGDGYVVTQPALDDVDENFYPEEETMDEDHLATCRLGEIFATSGIRRRRDENYLVHEIDWALFEFHDDRQPAENFVPRASIETSKPLADQESLHPSTVVPFSSLPGLEVQCMARTSGLQTGHIMPALTSVKIFGRQSASQTYQVSGSSPVNLNQPRNRDPPLGIPGDSGAWIIERADGRVCGHVLAWSQRKQVAYICPMDILLKDIADTLEARDVRLPCPGELESNVVEDELPITMQLEGHNPCEEVKFEGTEELGSHGNDKFRYTKMATAGQQLPPQQDTLPLEQDDATHHELAQGGYGGNDTVGALGIELDRMHLHSTGAR
ncbi:uncharacterized protein B0I36DRAFT_315999 [Microdochium trichocladiopsis]|uniref:Protein kinase domain-containing protein n=1 Tax=Microdochium trichocladiopsis TaxID=1682393 RepID=A0A9P8YI08_9PEZI|nr:uncharacterized protein B0I36DRAFT_315999 [Microdochium trichocladiopsis]KAH7038319.1 hypothetical protein B0I36DRAFT_315999 [Microdochium trichocladiopsis]